MEFFGFGGETWEGFVVVVRIIAKCEWNVYCLCYDYCKPTTTGPNTNFNNGGNMDFTALITALNLAAFSDIIESVLPIVGVAVLVGFLFYVVRWGIGLFRGI